MQQNLQIEKVISVLELPLSSWKLDRQTSKEQAVDALNEFKQLAEVQYKKLIKKYHPDLPGNGQNENDKLVEVNLIMEVVRKLQITVQQVQRPIMQEMHYHFRGNFGRSSFTNNTSTDSSFENGSGWFRFR